MTRVCRLCRVKLQAKLWIHWLLGGAQFPVSVWWAPLLERTLGVHSGGAGQGSGGTTVSSGGGPGLAAAAWADPWWGGWGLQNSAHRAVLVQSLQMGSRASWRREREGSRWERGKSEKTLRDRGKVSEKGEGERGGSG